MSPANVYTPARYDERVWHLAIGVEPRDATTGRLRSSGVDVRLERHPAPLHRWRRWRPGETLTGVLPSMRRHRAGRYSRRYDEGGPGAPAVLDVRLVDTADRRIVPRRVQLPVTDEAVVLAAEADPTTPPHPLWQRVFPLAVFPGAAADLTAGATVLRGRVVRTVAAGAPEPVRWCRVRARTTSGDDVGWAHGDDRGEFVLVVAPGPDGVMIPSDPLLVQLTVGATVPPPAPDPADPLRAQVDPLWDLPLETITPSPDPTSEPTLTGRAFLSQHTEFGPFAHSVPLGRESTVELSVP